jgi:hypothetical protein
MKKVKIQSTEQEFFRIYKLAQASNDADAWLAAKNKIESVEQSSVLGNALEHIALAATGIGPTLEAIKSTGITPETISKALGLGSGIGAVTASGVDMNKINKFSAAYRNANGIERKHLLKRANILSDITESISGVMPYLSVIFKGVSAIYNLYKAITSYQELAKEGEEVGLKWYQTLFPDYLDELLNSTENTSDPKKMGIIGTLCKVASNFIEQGMAAILQGISASVETYTMLTQSLENSDEQPGFISGFIAKIVPGLTAVLQIGYERLAPHKHKVVLQKVLSIIDENLTRLGASVAPKADAESPGLMSAVTSGASGLVSALTSGLSSAMSSEE